MPGFIRTIIGDWVCLWWSYFNFAFVIYICDFLYHKCQALWIILLLKCIAKICNYMLQEKVLVIILQSSAEFYHELSHITHISFWIHILTSQLKNYRFKNEKNCKTRKYIFKIRLKLPPKKQRETLFLIAAKEVY